MRCKFRSGLAVLVAVVVFSCFPPGFTSANYTFVYELLDHPGGVAAYGLNVAVSESLLEYYAGESHVVVSSSDFAKFVTPTAVKPIADCLRGIYPDDEAFSNGVLTMVHQIPYQVGPAKYPVETIVGNSGDCELFSYLAASIMKAGGLDVELLYYKAEEHMNIGVSLPNEPGFARGTVEYALDNGTKYYTAECTGSNFEDGWRVGECPPDLANGTAQAVALQNCEQSSPGQVSASYSTFTPSTLSLQVTPTYLTQGTSITVSGQLSPPLENETITIYAKPEDSSWSEFTVVPTDSSGCFTYTGAADFSGTCSIRANWSGDQIYASADSPTITITVLPLLLLATLSLATIIVAAGAIAILLSRRSRQGPSEPKPPKIPSC
jgi:hypothetical protein